MRSFEGMEFVAWLDALKPPTTKDDALDAARAAGAPAEVLDFLENLPEATYESEHGLEHALAGLRRAELPEHVPEEAEAEDGAPS